MRDRKTYIGGGDIACILGVGFKTPFQLWEQKLGRVEDTPPSIKMEMGLLLEDYIIDSYEKETGIKVLQRQDHLTHPDYEFFGGTVDGITEDCAVFDAKFSTQYGFDGGILPVGYQLQGQWYMMLSGLQEARFYVLHAPAGAFTTYVVERDDELIEEMITAAVDFWQCVQQDDPPAYCVGDKIGAWLEALKKKEDEHWADDDLASLLKSYQQATRKKTDAQKESDDLRAKILNNIRCWPDSIVDPLSSRTLAKISKRKDGSFHALRVLDIDSE